MRTRIMYIEHKPDGITGPARIGRVTFSKSGSSVWYQGRRFERVTDASAKANYLEAETGEPYWISGCKKRGGDRLYSGTIQIDADVREEYWTQIRGMPACKEQSVSRCAGKYSR